MKNLQILAVIIFALLSIKMQAQEKGNFKDPRDGKIYKTITIGNQTWFESNLNYKTPNGSSCYKKQESNCEKFGRLYKWETAKTACPKGWHLPSHSEWVTLTKDTMAGKLLKGFGKEQAKITRQEDAIQNSWWTATNIDKTAANYWELIEDFTFNEAAESIDTGFWSVRCLKD